MRKQDYGYIAESFKRTRPRHKNDIGNTEQWRRQVKDMTLMLKRLYGKNFDEVKFLKDVGL